MSRIAYVNGRYLPMRAAMVHVEDRGYQFADGVYEVCEVQGRAADRRAPPYGAAGALAQRIAYPHADVARALGVVLREVVARNRIRYGIVYLQITRGVARRDHAFPVPQVPPEPGRDHARTLNRARNETLAAKGIAVISVPDNRWGRVDIKTIGLLAKCAGAAGGDRAGRPRRLVCRR